MILTVIWRFIAPSIRFSGYSSNMRNGVITNNVIPVNNLRDKEIKSMLYIILK